MSGKEEERLPVKMRCFGCGVELKDNQSFLCKKCRNDVINKDFEDVEITCKDIENYQAWLARGGRFPDD